MFAALLVLVASAGFAWLQSSRTEYRYPVETKQVPLPAGTSTEASAALFANQRIVVRPGQDGLVVRYTYHKERWVDGVMVSRAVIHPKGKPSSEVISQPTTQVVAIGTREGTAVEVNAAMQSGQPLGTIGRSGIMRFEISGTVTFAGDLSECGPFGNAGYKFFQTPYRRDVLPGSALFSVGAGKSIALRELKKDKRTFVISGKPGQRVMCLVNDSPGYFEDNRGSFQVFIWKDGTAPR